MYIGRIVCVARTADGRLCGAYRVSSRSFPNRTAVLTGDKVSSRGVMYLPCLRARTTPAPGKMDGDGIKAP